MTKLTNQQFVQLDLILHAVRGALLVPTEHPGYNGEQMCNAAGGIITNLSSHNGLKPDDVQAIHAIVSDSDFQESWINAEDIRPFKEAEPSEIVAGLSLLEEKAAALCELYVTDYPSVRRHLIDTCFKELLDENKAMRRQVDSLKGELGAAHEHAEKLEANLLELRR